MDVTSIFALDLFQRSNENVSMNYDLFLQFLMALDNIRRNLLAQSCLNMLPRELRHVHVK